MPHVIYLHSALTQSRIRGENEGELKRIQRFERIDVIIAMTIAGLVNLSMLAIFAARFFGTDADSIEDAYHGLYADPGRWAAVPARDRAPRFGPLLLLGRHARRAGRDAGLHPPPDPDLRPARDHRGARRSLVALVGVDPTRALVLSQVVLSFGIPFALVPLVLFTSRRKVMGGLVNNRVTTVAAWAIAVFISA